jgi:hypothetical protein
MRMIIGIAMLVIPLVVLLSYLWYREGTWLILAMLVAAILTAIWCAVASNLMDR